MKFELVNHPQDFPELREGKVFEVPTPEDGNSYKVVLPTGDILYIWCSELTNITFELREGESK